jgi:acyl transferase domain-containing protein/acyl carrier protein
VSAFGASGTNAHAIIEEAPPAHREPCPAPASGPLVLLVSAKDRRSLGAQAQRLYEHISAHPELELADVAHSLASTRAQLPFRLAVIGQERERLLEDLQIVARGESKPGLPCGAAIAGPRVALLLTGQGAQRAGMGRGLYDRYEVFASALDGVCGELDRHLERSLRELLFCEPGSPDSELLNQTAITQAALFALEVALFRLVESWGIAPAYLLGHSVGEITAAHIAGSLSLGDASRFVAARGRLMQALPEGGAMVAVQGSEDEILDSLGSLREEVSLAAVNGPSAVVLSGPAESVERVASLWDARGRATKRLPVSHAFHSALMEPMLAELREVARTLHFSPPTITIVSNLTGKPLSVEQACSPDYWVDHARSTVRFMDGMRWLDDAGVDCFIELGPDGVLSAAGRDCVEREQPQTGPLLVAAMRRKRPEAHTLLAAMAEAHVRGVPVKWSEVLPGEAVELCTYAFQRKRFWVQPVPARTGGTATGHPLLSTETTIAGRDEWVFEGSVSLAAQPWLADHTVGGVVLVSGTSFVEMALWAGARVGCGTLEEIALEAPLALGEQDALALQLCLGEPEQGRRSFTLHSRDQAAGEWRRHAAGMFTGALSAPADPGALGEWPAPGAQRLDLDALYERLSDHGLGYGPSFKCARAAWRRGEAVFTSVELPDGADVSGGGFAIHPGLLDAAFHALVDPAGELSLPFSWSGVRLGASRSTKWRVLFAPAGAGAVSMHAFDEAGRPVVSAEAVVARPVPAEQLASLSGEGGGGLYVLSWNRLDDRREGMPEDCVALGEVGVALVKGQRHSEIAGLLQEMDRGVSPPGLVLASVGSASVHARVGDALSLLRRWLADERLADSRLVFLTRGAVAPDGAESLDPAASAVWGLVRTAQSEHPGRFVLADIDGDPRSEAVLAAALGSGEQQVAMRAGTAYVPSVERVAHPAAPARELFDPHGTVLITGGTGGIGASLARHLVKVHSAHYLTLVSRRGESAPGAAALKDELVALGADVTIAACDVSDREAVGELLRAIPSGSPLSGVIHAAGVLDDGVIESLTAERLRRVLEPKVDGALNLHDLTRELELRSFVLISSVSGTIGGPAQANYAAANAFLDALAVMRRAEGLPACSQAWGLWGKSGELTAHLRDSDRARLAAGGLLPISNEEAMDMFDAAVGLDLPHVMPVRVDMRALRAAVRLGAVSMLLARPVGLRAPARPDAERELTLTLSECPDGEREAILLKAVCGHLAEILGHGEGDTIEVSRTFKDLGLDSLGAIDLRNRLGSACGLRLPSTLTFDYPTPVAVARHLHARMGGGAEGSSSTVTALDELEQVLAGHMPSGSEIERMQRIFTKFASSSPIGAERILEASEDEIYALIDGDLRVPDQGAVEGP